MNILERFKTMFGEFTPLSVFEILLITFVLTFMMKVLLDNNAGRVIWVYLAFTLLTGLYIFFAKVQYGALAMIVLQAVFVLVVVCLFATEIKRTIWYKRVGDHKHGDRKNTQDTNVCIEEIVKAVQNMSRTISAR